MPDDDMPPLRWRDLLCIAVAGALLAAVSVLAQPTTARAADAPAESASPPITVLEVRCDGHGSVVAMKVAIPAPGVLDIQWDNRTACGGART